MSSTAESPFQILGRSRPFRGHVVDVRVDRIAGPDGRIATREVVEHPGAVAALAVDGEGEVLLVDQWRQAVGARLVEIPAGKYDVRGESVEDALRRELAEELRVEGGTLTWLVSFYTSPGWSDEVVDLYLAEGVRPIDGRAPEADWEEAGLRVVRLRYDQALAMATSRPPGDSKTLVALALYGLRRAGRWAPDPAGHPTPDAPARRAASRPA
ncbi:MAG TPA: NUDIX hydrolase [Actinomycetes bacterium]|nr:NUDIX hydrolase [Actinomycetes bacterium]